VGATQMHVVEWIGENGGMQRPCLVVYTQTRSNNKTYDKGEKHSKLGQMHSGSNLASSQ